MNPGPPGSLLGTGWRTQQAAAVKKGAFSTEQSFGLCGRGRGRDDMGEWH